MRTALILASLVFATAAGAQTPAKPATTAKPAAANAAPAAPAKRTATVTTKSGKKMTYDCTKKGNANKTACKG